VVLVAAASFAAYSLNNSKNANISSAPASFANNQSVPVTPGPMPFFSCQFLSKNPQQLDLIGSSGFKEHESNGITDYILSAGRRGSITFQIPVQNVVSNSSGTTSVNLSSNSDLNDYGTNFYHQTNYNESPIVTDVGTGAGNGRYRVCYSSPCLGTTCSYSSNSNAPSKNVNAVSLMHRGVHANILRAKNSALNLTISTNASVASGTYWFTIGGGPCNGGYLALLTIGNAPYNGTYNSSSGAYA
jgi:hypothetical protein